MRVNRLIAVAIVVLGLTVGSSLALAQTDAKPKKAQAAVKGGLLEAAAAYVGVTRRQLLQELRGHSLAQVAVAHGKSVDGLKQALLDALKARLDRATANERITPARAQAILSRASARIDKLVNHVFDGKAAKAKQLGKGLNGVAAEYIGVTRQQLRSELKGHSLAQVAAAHGKSVTGLKQALLGALKARVDKAVAAERITPARAERILGRAAARIDKLVNHVFA